MYEIAMLLTLGYPYESTLVETNDVCVKRRSDENGLLHILERHLAYIMQRNEIPYQRLDSCRVYC